MKIKTMLLAATAVMAMAFAAVPSVAAAFETTPTLDPPGGVFPSPIEGISGPGSLFAVDAEGNPLPPVECKSDSNKGEFDSSMTGTAVVTFHECELLESECHSAAQPAGTIQTEELPFHLVYLKPANPEDPHELPGILFTPNANGKFAEFECLGGLAKFVVAGNGVLGAITEPEIVPETGESLPSETATIDVSATPTGQEFTETVEGEKYGLNVSINGGEATPAFQDAGPAETTFVDGPAILTTE